MNEQEIKNFMKEATSWVTLFTSLYQTKDVTPYMHVLVAHVPKLLRDVGSLAKFSQQGLEKLNDDITKDYVRSTNQHDGESLSQLMLNQLEELSHDFSGVKNIHLCQLCQSTGHYSCTCLNKSEE